MEVGDLKSANAYLGHPYRLTAVCTDGTLQLPAGIALPKPGTYDCQATVDGKSHPAIVRLTPNHASIELPGIDWNRHSVTLEFHSPIDKEG
jgi:FAD synthase